MKDRYYKRNTRSTYHNVSTWLKKHGYKETTYGDSAYYPNVGYAYYEKPGVCLKLMYHWVKETEKSYVSGKMISLEDVSDCFSEIMGKETGYR